MLEGLRPLRPRDVVRGQYQGYRQVKGVEAGSTVETYAAVRLRLDTWRWNGVPIFVRAGKCLPVTATEIVVDLKPPPQDVFAEITRGHSNCVRFRIGDEMSDLDQRQGLRPRHPPRARTSSCSPSGRSQAMVPPYERLLTDAMQGNRLLFSNQATVDAMWRVVDPILDDTVPVETYKPGTWGPAGRDAHGGSLRRLEGSGMTLGRSSADAPRDARATVTSATCSPTTPTGAPGWWPRPWGCTSTTRSSA